MVLDETSPQSSGTMSTSDGGSSSPLTIPSASSLRLQINPETIVSPDPFTLYFGFAGNMNWQRNVVRAISERVDNSRVLMGRNPTQEEVDAFVTYSTRSLYEKRIGAPVAGAIVAARLYSQARSSTYFRGMMGLPPLSASAGGAGGAGADSAGGKPVMPTLRQMVDGIVTTAKVDAAGFRSGLGMVASRFFVWTITAATVSGVFAVYNDAVGTFSDSRLAEFVKLVKNQDPEELRKRKVEAASERHRSSQQQRQPSQQLDQSQEQEQLSTEIVSDQSPQQQQQLQLQGAAAGIAESQKYEQENNGYASLYSNAKSASQRDQQPQQSFESRPSAQGSDSVSDFFDDASPTAPEYQGTLAPSTVIATPQRGAWERIRQQNLGFGGRQENSNSNSSNDGDQYQEYNARYGGNTSSYQSYGNNNPDNEKQRDREQARAEFERMLDAERNMSSDDSSSSGRGFWK